jgi:hypothetical protein
MSIALVVALDGCRRPEPPEARPETVIDATREVVDVEDADAADLLDLRSPPSSLGPVYGASPDVDAVRARGRLQKVVDSAYSDLRRCNETDAAAFHSAFAVGLSE